MNNCVHFTIAGCIRHLGVFHRKTAPPATDRGQVLGSNLATGQFVFMSPFARA